VGEVDYLLLCRGSVGDGGGGEIDRYLLRVMEGSVYIHGDAQLRGVQQDTGVGRLHEAVARLRTPGQYPWWTSNLRQIVPPCEWLHPGCVTLRRNVSRCTAACGGFTSSDLGFGFIAGQVWPVHGQSRGVLLSSQSAQLQEAW
jgi:hypothetical protein